MNGIYTLNNNCILKYECCSSVIELVGYNFQIWERLVKNPQLDLGFERATQPELLSVVHVMVPNLIYCSLLIPSLISVRHNPPLWIPHWVVIKNCVLIWYGIDHCGIRGGHRGLCRGCKMCHTPCKMWIKIKEILWKTIKHTSNNIFAQNVRDNSYHICTTFRLQCYVNKISQNSNQINYHRITVLEEYNWMVQ